MKKQYVLAFTAILCWSSVATVIKLLLGSLNSIQVLFISSFFAALALLLFNVFTGKMKTLKNFRPKDFIIMILICLPSTLLYYVFYYTGTSKMLASQAFIVNYLWPIMSVVFACIILKEKMTVAKLLAIFLSFAGIIVIIGEDLLHFETQTLFGAVFCILGAVSYGLFTALNQRFKYDKSISMMLSYFVTFIIIGLYLLISENLPKVGAYEILGLAWNGVATMAVANMVWILALGNGNTAKISNLAYLTPFISLVWTAIFLKEKINLLSFLGLAIIMLGILIQILYKDKTPKKKIKE